MSQSADFEVTMPPSDTISALEFSPAPSNFLCAASWDQTVRFWSVEMDGSTIPKSCCSLSAPVLDVSWNDKCDQIYLCTAGHELHAWDLESNKLVQLGVHDAGVRSCHWIHTPNFSCLMSASWDKTVKFWDPRCSEALLKLNLPDRCYASDVLYPLAAVVCANNTTVIISLDHPEQENKCLDSEMKQQLRCVSFFQDKGIPTGFTVAGIEGRAAVYYLNREKDTCIFNCHRSICPEGYQNIFATNDLKYHPIHNTLVTVGSDGVYIVWDTQQCSRLFTSSVKEQPLTKCCFNSDGHIFAYALGYDWTRGHEFNDPNKKPQILLNSCFEDMKAKK